jgi:hypothetical protein
MWCEALDLAVEYNGEQHYRVVPIFHPEGEADLARQRERDATKVAAFASEYACLVVVPYTAHAGRRTPAEKTAAIAEFLYDAVAGFGYSEGVHRTKAELLAIVDAQE